MEEDLRSGGPLKRNCGIIKFTARVVVIALVASGPGVAIGSPVSGLPRAVNIDDVSVRFDYSMPSRYLADDNGVFPNPVPHVECTDSGDPGSCRTIAATIDVQPADGWRVDLDACASTPGPDQITYRWRLPAALEGTVEVQQGDSPCTFFVVFPEEGTFDISLFLVDGFSVGYSRRVIVQDFLIVALGDSAGAGEGAPDVVASDGVEPVWVDRRCHRSAFNGTARAALLLEELDPHTSVTYVNLACSGARVMEGLIEPYAGVDRIALDKYPEVELAKAGLIPELPPQLQAAAELVDGREIDAIDISIGVNDAHFAGIVQSCALAEPCETTTTSDALIVAATAACAVLIVPVAGLACAAIVALIVGVMELAFGSGWATMTGQELLDEGLGGDGLPTTTCVTCGLPEGYRQLAAALLRAPATAAGSGRADVGLGLPGLDADRVYISEYMDPTTKPFFDSNDPESDLCGGIEDTFTMFPGVSRTETRWLRGEVLARLNGEVADGAGAHGWTFVDRISSSFYQHGYCADDHWVVRLDETIRDQHDMQGVIHPNRAGYRAFRNRILNAWLPDLYPDSDGSGPGITGSDSTVEARSKAAGHLEFHPDPRMPSIPFVTAGASYVVAEGGLVGLEGTATDPSDADLDMVWTIADSAPSGIATVVSPVGFSAILRGRDDGSGHVALTATNDALRSSSALAYFTVENVAPEIDVGLDTSIAEGSAFTRSVVLSDPGTLDTHIASVSWGDGTSQTLGLVSSPSFDVTHVYADDGTYSVSICATDDDGGFDCGGFDVSVTNAVPMVTVGSVDANEGALATLPPTSVDDLGTLDTHSASVDWGDGTATEVGTVSETPFGPPGSTAGLVSTITSGAGHRYGDNGSYTVTVCATDDDGGSSCGTGSVIVANAAPTATIVTVGEGPGFFLPLVSVPLAGTFHDVGTMDTHTARVTWGDGSTSVAAVIETPYGPPGSAAGLSGTATAAHAYVAAGVYTATLTVTDDDGGQGSASGSVAVLTPLAAVERMAESLRALAVDPTVSAAARAALQRALSDLYGAANGRGNSGVDDKLRDGDLVAAIVTMQSAVANLEAAIAGDGSITARVRLAELVIAQIAESVAAEALGRATSAVGPGSTSGQLALVNLTAMLAQGVAQRLAANYVAALASFKRVTQGALALLA